MTNEKTPRSIANDIWDEAEKLNGGHDFEQAQFLIDLIFSAITKERQAAEELEARLKIAVNGETSDGYHTFNELYEHRVLLWINLCLNSPQKCYWRDGHDGWPLLGMETDLGQISYHVPEKYLHLFSKKIKQGGPEWDKHTSNDVLTRLQALAEIAGHIKGSGGKDE